MLFTRNFVSSALVAIAVYADAVSAESHTVHFINNCRTGTPTLLQGGKVLNPGGGDFTMSGPLSSAIAYLQDGRCGLNGENCLMLETTLINPDPSKPGSGSSTDLTLIPPHEFSFTTSFSYFNGCNGVGNSCNSQSCTGAFHQSNDTNVQRACQTNDVDLNIQFC